MSDYAEQGVLDGLEALLPSLRPVHLGRHLDRTEPDPLPSAFVQGLSNGARDAGGSVDVRPETTAELALLGPFGAGVEGPRVENDSP